MTPTQFNAALKKWNLSQRGFARWRGINERTARHWVKEGPPEWEGRVFRLMLRLNLKPEDVK